MNLPITLVTACVAGLMLIWLSVRVIAIRGKDKVLIGDGDSEELLYRIRTHANLSEYFPLFLILLGLVEGAGGNSIALMLLAGVFIIARVLHVLGMGPEANLTLRQFGMVGTFTGIACTSLYGLVLGLT